MKILLLSITTVAVTLSLFCLRGSGQVSTPENRLEVLDQIERFEIVPLRDVKDIYANALDPFSPDEPEKEEEEDVVSEPEVVAPVEVLVDDEQILREISAQINPTGVLQLGSRNLLLFGERRVGAGDYVFGQHNGKEYQLQVLAVTRGDFTLQLNQEVISKRIQ